MLANNHTMDESNRAAEVPVTIDVLGLVRVLVGPSTEEQRFDWARYLLIQARQSDSDLRNLYHSLHKKGPNWHRELQQLRRGSAAAPQSRGSGSSSSSQATTEREDLAADMAELAAQWAQLALAKSPEAEPDEAAKANDDFDEIEESAVLQDVLRSGNAHTSSAPRSEPEQEEQRGEADSLRFCRPHWQQGADPKLAQATLRFEPGLEAGERVLVEGPAGEQLTLLVPPGLMHVQRALACVSRAPSRPDPRGGDPKSDQLMLQLDIVPLPLSAVPGGRLDVAGVSFLLPPSAVPGASLCVALPLNRS